MGKSTEPQLVDLRKEDLLAGLSKEDLRQKANLLHLGELCAAALASQGQIHLFLHEDGTLRIANPLHVYLDAAALSEDGHQPKFRWRRPVLGADKPQYVAWRDSQLWEIEILGEEEPDEVTGG